jgi:undecaprenyl-phosphate 4-deoxy-4-formamido-L-arabinose transferase
VYRGERTLCLLTQQIKLLNDVCTTAQGVRYLVSELILVHDCGPDRSDEVIESLAAAHDFVRPVWLTRNNGQHPATLAGMASATGDWVVTLDEDGQQNPADIPALLDTALAHHLQVVYAQPSNSPPHSGLRNLLSRTAKSIASRLLGNAEAGRFNSFRLLRGDIARTLAAYCGNGVFLDVGLFWVAGRIGHCPVQLRTEMDRPSGYSYFKLLGHFWNLVLSTGTRPLRLITLMGALSVAVSLLLVIYALHGRFFSAQTVPGWASVLMVLAFFNGAVLMALGIIAEYLAVTMSIVMGKPLYVVSPVPTRSPNIGIQIPTSDTGAAPARDP